MKAVNKKANYEYKLTGDTYEAGISLLGSEARAIRTGHLDLSLATARIIDGQIYLVNANIPVKQPPKNYSSTRTRKLLLKRSEIISITTKVKQFKLTLVPIKLYNKGRFFKIELSLGKPKRKFEKRESIKKKDIEREFEKEFKIK